MGARLIPGHLSTSFKNSQDFGATIQGTVRDTAEEQRDRVIDSTLDSSHVCCFQEIRSNGLTTDSYNIPRIDDVLEKKGKS